MRNKLILVDHFGEGFNELGDVAIHDDGTFLTFQPPFFAEQIGNGWGDGSATGGGLTHTSEAFTELLNA